MPSSTPRPAPGEPPGARAARRFLERVFPPPRRFAVRLPDGSVLPSEGEPAFTLVVPSAHGLRRAFVPPLGASLGDACARGDLEVQGDPTAVEEALESCASAVSSPWRLAALVSAWLSLPSSPAATSAWSAPAPPGQARSRARVRAAARYHHDVGNAFYALFLDARMVYSCGYFAQEDQDLDGAQERKLDLVCRKLRLRPGHRLLDVGCGWGGLLVHAARHYGVRAVGVTLGEREHEEASRRVAEAGLSDRVDVLLRDYRDLPGETFDRVASAGVFEHVGRAGMAEYFATVRGLLRPGGLFLHEAVSSRASTAERRPRLARWIVGEGAPFTRSVFPDAEALTLAEAIRGAEDAGFEVRDVEGMREHCALTLERWLGGLAERREEAVALVGEETYRAWTLYYSAALRRFRTGRTTAYQALFARPEGGHVDAPLDRPDLRV